MILIPNHKKTDRASGCYEEANVEAPKTSRSQQRWLQKDWKFLAVNMETSTKSIQLQTAFTFLLV